MTQKFPMVAKTFAGLEDVLRDELIALGAANVELGNRMVSFEGDLALMYKANIACRTALKILKPIEKFTASNPDELYDIVRDIDWSRYMGPDSTFSIDSTVNSAEFSHSRFVTYRVKDGIADHFSDSCGRRPSIRVTGADVQLDVHISGNRVTISLNSSGEPLCRRGYREEQTAAPINEVLAAGIILKTGWRGDVDFLDPMCGSGTFLTEAALIAARIHPGIYRTNFAFEKWPDFDADLWNEIYNDDSEERTPECRIIGSDIDPDAVSIARKNIRSARLDSMIELSCLPFQECEAPAPEGIIVTNPPYGERLRPDDIDTLFREIGTTLKNNFKGWHAWILGYRDEHFSAIGLKPSVKIPLNNGPLDCHLNEYVMFSGAYSDFRSKGGSVKDDKPRGDEKKARRYMSDKEWEKEARSFTPKGGKVRKFRREEDRRENRRPQRERNDRRERDERRPRPEFREKRREPGFRDEFAARADRDFRSRTPQAKHAGSRHAAPKGIVGKGPSLPEESTVKFSEYKLRSRKRKSSGETENQD